MSTPITVNVSDHLYRRAKLWTQRTGQPITEFLSEALEASIVPFLTPPDDESKWSDAEVISAADATMPQEENDRFSELLNRQQEGVLTLPERVELGVFLHTYQVGLLRKALGLKEAVRRGLREPLES